MKKRLHFLLFWNGVEHGTLVWGKEFCCDLLRFRDKADVFDVNSQSGLPGPRDQGQAVRMRHVKVEARPDSLSGNNRFSAGFISESHQCRFNVQVTAQDHSEHSVADDEPIAIAVEPNLFR